MAVLGLDLTQGGNMPAKRSDGKEWCDKCLCYVDIACLTDDEAEDCVTNKLPDADVFPIRVPVGLEMPVVHA